MKPHSDSIRAKDSQDIKIPFFARKKNRAYALATLTTTLFFLIIFVAFSFLASGPKIVKPAKLQWIENIPEENRSPAQKVISSPEMPASIRAYDRVVQQPKSGESPGGTELDRATAPRGETVGVEGTSSAGNDERDRKIEEVLPFVLEDLRSSEAITADTIFLKTGKRIDCVIVGESGTRVKIQRKGATITVAKERILRMERRTPEEVEQGLERAALARAAQIVDEDLVWDRQSWVSRKETAKYNLDLIYSLLRQRKPIETEFIHGRLSLSPQGKARPNGGVDEKSSIAFQAKAVGLSVSVLRKILSLPIAASGTCDIDATGAFEETNPTGISGHASFTGTDILISSVDLDMVDLPPSSGVLLRINLVANKGEIQVKNLALTGSAYDLSGTGKIKLSNPLENSRINFSFSVIFKEPPTLKDRELVALGADGFMRKLVAQRTAVPFDLTGTIKSSQMSLAKGSSLSSMMP